MPLPQHSLHQLESVDRPHFTKPTKPTVETDVCFPPPTSYENPNECPFSPVARQTVLAPSNLLATAVPSQSLAGLGCRGELLTFLEHDLAGSSLDDLSCCEPGLAGWYASQPRPERRHRATGPLADGLGNGELQPLFLQSQPRQEQQTRRQPSQHKPPMAKSMISKRLGGRVNGELDERLVGPPGQESGRRVPMTVNNAIEPNREKLVPSKALPTDRQTETGHFQKRPYRTPAHGTGITIVTVASPLDAACLPAQSTETGDLVDQTRASLKQPWQQTTRKRTQHQSHGRPSAGQHIQHQLVASDTSALRPSVDSSLAVGGSVGVEINDLSTGNSPESCSHPNHRHRHIHSHNHQHHSRRHQPQHRQPPQADQPILIQSEHQMEYFLAPAGPRTHLRQNNRQHKSHSDKQRMDRTTSTDRPTKQSVASDESALILEPDDRFHDHPNFTNSDQHRFCRVAGPLTTSQPLQPLRTHDSLVGNTVGAASRPSLGQTIGLNANRIILREAGEKDDEMDDAQWQEEADLRERKNGPLASNLYGQAESDSIYRPKWMTASLEAGPLLHNQPQDLPIHCGLPNEMVQKTRVTAYSAFEDAKPLKLQKSTLRPVDGHGSKNPVKRSNMPRPPPLQLDGTSPTTPSTAMSASGQLRATAFAPLSSMSGIATVTEVPTRLKAAANASIPVSTVDRQAGPARPAGVSDQTQTARQLPCSLRCNTACALTDGISGHNVLTTGRLPPAACTRQTDREAVQRRRMRRLERQLHRSSEAQRPRVTVGQDMPQTAPAEAIVTAGSPETTCEMMPLSSRPITMEITLTRGPRGFGFSIAGGVDNPCLAGPADWLDKTGAIYVTRINPGGVAESAGGLKLYDRIIAANSLNLVGATHNEAVEVLKQAGPRLKLVVERKPPVVPPSLIAPLSGFPSALGESVSSSGLAISTAPNEHVYPDPRIDLFAPHHPPNHPGNIQAWTQLHPSKASVNRPTGGRINGQCVIESGGILDSNCTVEMADTEKGLEPGLLAGTSTSLGSASLTMSSLASASLSNAMQLATEEDEVEVEEEGYVDDQDHDIAEDDFSEPDRDCREADEFSEQENDSHLDCQVDLRQMRQSMRPSNRSSSLRKKNDGHSAPGRDYATCRSSSASRDRCSAPPDCRRVNQASEMPNRSKQNDSSQVPPIVGALLRGKPQRQMEYQHHNNHQESAVPTQYAMYADSSGIIHQAPAREWMEADDTNIGKLSIASLNFVVTMIHCYDDFRHDGRTGIEGDYLGKSASMNLPVKPIESWSRGIRRRLLVKPTFESLHPTLLLEIEVGLGNVEINVAALEMIQNTGWNCAGVFIFFTFQYGIPGLPTPQRVFYVCYGCAIVLFACVYPVQAFTKALLLQLSLPGAGRDSWARHVRQLIFCLGVVVASLYILVFMINYLPPPPPPPSSATVTSYFPLALRNTSLAVRLATASRSQFTTNVTTESNSEMTEHNRFISPTLSPLFFLPNVSITTIMKVPRFRMYLCASQVLNNLAFTLFDYAIHQQVRRQPRWAGFLTCLFWSRLLYSVIEYFISLSCFLLVCWLAIYDACGISRLFIIVCHFGLVIYPAAARGLGWAYRRMVFAKHLASFASPSAQQLEALADMCPICHTEMTPESAKVTRCTHVYHTDCLAMWMRRRPVCPVCQTDLLSTNVTSQRRLFTDLASPEATMQPAETQANGASDIDEYYVHAQPLTRPSH